MIRADYLRCEYLIDPIGVDSPDPRLSWKPAVVDPKAKGTRQSGYRILVASSPSLLRPTIADFWDSGVVRSDDSFGIPYGGKPVPNGKTVYWKVRLVDGTGKASAWSRSAEWTAGPKWSARWVQFPGRSDDEGPIEANNGFHGAEADREDDRQWVQIDLGASAPLDEFRLYPARPFDFADTPGFLFPVRFKIEASDDPDFAAPRLVVDATENDYPNPGDRPVTLPASGHGRYVRLTVTKLKQRDANVFSYALAELEVISGGKNVAIHRPVTASKSTEIGEWSKAHLVDGDTVSHGPRSLPPLPATVLRREFELDETPRRANLFVSALGAYEITINGKRVGDRILAPEWTDYRDRVQYQGYDVSKLLRKGRNLFEATLGDGWYAGRIAWFHRAMYGRNPSLIAQLEGDGKLLLASDRSWKSTDEGPIRASDILDGENFDARVEPSGWKPARLLRGKTPKLVFQPNEPIRVHAELEPIHVSEPKSDVFVVDMGQNMVGWARVRLRGRKGDTARIRYAEVLSPDGMIYTENLRTAEQTDTYVFARTGQATFEPHFTYHGFRYVEITGVSARPSLGDVVGRVFNSASPEVGSFICSEPMLNRLWENILWTQRANLMSSPTDCPQRNERLGWMGDIQAFGQTAVFNMDMNGFFAKWTQDLRDAQSSNGLYPEYAPWPSAKDTAVGSPAWSDAGVFVPWLAYQSYGDLRLLNDHYASAKRYVDFLQVNNPDGLWLHRRGNDFNDWLNGDTLIQKGYPTTGGAVPPEVLATAFMARSTEIVGEMAEALGNKADARHYLALARHCREAFVRAYVDSDARVKGETQAGYALALSFDLLPHDMRRRASEHLVEAVAKYGDHISTGIQTTHRMMLELTRWGFNDLAYKLMLNRTFPSWGYTIDNGATTIWERWDGYVKGRGFQNPGMNSFNHWALGSVGEWMTKVIGGIWPGDRPGWKHPLIHPIPGGGLTWASASYDSIRGKVSVSWKLERGALKLNFTIPANITATVIVPAGSQPMSIETARKLASEHPGLKFERRDDRGWVYEAVSGTYEIEISSV